MKRMNTLSWAILLAVAGEDRLGYAQELTLPEELVLMPESAVYAMLGIRLLLLAVGRPWRCKKGIDRESCTWVGRRRVCACAS